MLKYEDLKNKPKEVLAATELKQDEFEALLVAVGKAYAEAYPADQSIEGQARQRRIGGGEIVAFGRQPVVHPDR